MLAKTYSYGLMGLDAYPVTIEVDVTRGLPSTNIVGLPDNAIKESKERVRSAILNSGFKYNPPDFPSRKTINLSPADTKKEGPCFDLAMAIGILAATQQIDASYLSHYAFLGELSLDGFIKPIRGTLAVAIAVRNSSFKGLILPYHNAPETALLNNQIAIYPFKTLNEVICFLQNPENFPPYRSQPDQMPSLHNSFDVDFSDVKGQLHVKRGLEIAAAGSHNVLLIGPPGSGKSMLAKRFPTILPNMTLEETLETTQIHSVMGLLNSTNNIVNHRPFRSPHHTTSDVAIVGGGSHPKPGEVTISHNGVLFLDEFPEFNRDVIEALRQPMEDQCVTIARANKSLLFPARFQLIAAMNPCPCGFLTDQKRECRCNPHQIQKYLAKISGPLLDRIDLHLEVPALPSHDLLSLTPSESSVVIKDRTSRVRQIQMKRFCNTKILANAHMNHRQIKQFCHLDTESKQLLKAAIEELNLSARAYDKILKVARTIADLAKTENIQTEHLAEAIQYRSLDRNWWN